MYYHIDLRNIELYINYLESYHINLYRITPFYHSVIKYMYHAILFPAANKASHQADHLDSDDQMKHAGRQSEANDCQELHKQIVKPAKMFHRVA